MKSTHGGHRGRLLGKVRSGGVLYDHETIEVLLFNACPRRDLNATAHALLDRFGGVHGLMRASVEELSSVDGVGENMAEYIRCLSAVLDNLHGCECFAEAKSISDFIEYARSDRTAAGCVSVCFADKDGRIRRKAILKASSDGKTSLKEFYKMLAASRPYGVFVSVLRREGEECRPYEADDGIAEDIYSAVSLCGARFYDYCIIGADENYYSYYMKERIMFSGNNGEIK